MRRYDNSIDLRRRRKVAREASAACGVESAIDRSESGGGLVAQNGKASVNLYIVRELSQRYINKNLDWRSNFYVVRTN